MSTQPRPSRPGGGASSLLPILLPLLENVSIPIGDFSFPLGPSVRELVEGLRDGRIDGQEARRLAFVTVSSASHLLEREVHVGGRVYNLTPVIRELSVALSDGDLTSEEIRRLLPGLVLVLAASRIAPRVAAPQPIVIPSTPPPAQPAPRPIPSPASPASTGGRMVRIVRLKAKLTGIFDRRNQPVTPDPLPGVLRGDNWDNGFIGHSDCTPILEDGTELRTGDPRWKELNRWAPNGNAIFPYYEYNGQLTDIRHGDHGSEFVEPESFEDDEGCTVSWKVDTADPHNTQATFRFGYMYKAEDGSFVDSGLIGQGNKVDGEPFNIR